MRVFKPCVPGIEPRQPFHSPLWHSKSACIYDCFSVPLFGQNSTITTACATGTQTIGEAAELIRRGSADVMITGGTEALIHDFSIAGFCAMRASADEFQ